MKVSFKHLVLNQLEGFLFLGEVTGIVRRRLTILLEGSFRSITLQVSITQRPDDHTQRQEDDSLLSDLYQGR